MKELARVIADASSLIVLARLDALWILERLFVQALIVPGVRFETVVQGKARGYADAERIETAIQTKQIEMLEPTRADHRLAAQLGQQTPALSETDCMTLACAKTRNLLLLMEEQRGRNVALAQEIMYVTIQVLPLRGFIVQRFSFEECASLLERIGTAMRTDKAILSVLHAAATEIRDLRTSTSEDET